MKASSPCNCQHGESDPCGPGHPERPRYFAGQLLTETDMTLEQQYFRDKLRRHNRLMHGWGVVCGAALCAVPEEQGAEARKAAPASPDRPRPNTEPNEPRPDAAGRTRSWTVCVQPGYVLGPYGDEILIDRERIVDLRTLGLAGAAGEHGEPPDPWCADVFVQREPGPLWIAVRYKEMPSRPVRVAPAGCGCDESQCEYSRWCDGYEIGVLTECPPSHEDPPSLAELFQKDLLPRCPACPQDGWVVLARVEVGGDGEIQAIDNCVCRRLVLSFGPLWWRCTGEAREEGRDEDRPREERPGPGGSPPQPHAAEPKQPRARRGKGKDGGK